MKETWKDYKWVYIFLSLIVAVIITVIIVIVQSGSENSKQSGDSSIRIYKDPQTGCEYLLYNSESIYPRLDKDNKIICGGD